MTCYFRHLGLIFTKAGITVTAENKKQLDKVIHDIVHIDYKNCPDTWCAVKYRLAEDESKFMQDLKTAWVKQQQK
jgi:hypothetical protein